MSGGAPSQPGRPAGSVPDDFRGATWSGYATADLPGIGGVIKQRPSDFLVEEIPAYQPSGEGEHVYLFVEKEELSTTEMARIVARHFGVPVGAIGFAGMKDKHAVTRQVVSVHTPGRKPEDFPMLHEPRVRVLWTDLHANKLRLGHLRANRFSIKVRGVRAMNVVQAKRVLDALHTIGVPNFAGEQRFGYRANNHELGRLLLLADEKGFLDELLGPDPRHPDVNPQMREAYARGDYRKAAEY
ncbi:MAG TPA: tRNA pseudouridine(13) synthase TruD, partial [Phycisphaerales bacterium]|nr:tRNA pseudouridine(13) synthase TruD [Phycisphaerales bacterium]